MFKSLKIWWFYKGSKILQPFKPLINLFEYIHLLIDEKYILYKYRSKIDVITYINIYFTDGSWYTRWRRYYEYSYDWFDFMDMVLRDRDIYDFQKSRRNK